MATGSPLFGNRDLNSASKALVEFRAGKMNKASDSNLVTADKRKGLIQIDQGEDQLMHLKWKDRESGLVEDDLIIFPDDIEFVRVTQCKTGRVFVLRFKSSSRRRFFWMQEPKEDKDEEYCKKVNDLLNKRAKRRTSEGSGSGLASGRGGGAPNGVGSSQLQSYLRDMNREQLLQLFGENLQSHPAAIAAVDRLARSGILARGSSSAEPAVPETNASTTTASKAEEKETASGGTGAVQLSDLQSVLSGIKAPATNEEQLPINLALGITGSAIKPLLTNPDFVKKMKDLLPNIESDAANEIESTVSSPQFQQALQLFSAGLQSGQLAPLIRGFNLGDSAVAAATAGDMEAFVKAFQEGCKKDDISTTMEGGDVSMEDA